MSFADDTAELLPKPARRGPITGAVWGALAFGLVCVVIGAVIGLWGARLFPAKAPAQAAAPTATAPSAGVASTGPEAPSAAPPTPAPTAAPSADVADLKARVQRLESEERATVDAASAALAAASLNQAADTSRPFARDVDALSRALPDSRDLEILRGLAQVGAPTRSALAAEFPDVAQKAAYASHAPGDQASLLTRIFHAISAVVTIRRTDRLTGDDPDAVLARAERAVGDGDLETALKELNALPQAGRDAVAAWREKASRRIEIQRRIAAIRSDALRALAVSSRSVAP
jgi:hypothetical protein